MTNPESLNQWTDCLSDNKGKRPRINPAHPQEGLSYDEARKRAALSQASKNYGFIFSKDDPYIGLDVDVDPNATTTGKNATTEIPPEVLLLLENYPTHCHYSPSGHGLHIIYKLSSPGQEFLNQHNLAQGACSLEKGAIFNGDWRWDRSFLTFTNNLHPLCADISTIDLHVLESVVGLSIKAPITTSGLEVIDQPQPSPVIDMVTRLQVQAHLPSIAELILTLKDLPASLDARATRACGFLKHSAPTSNYEYWVLIGQACAHTAIALQAFEPDAISLVTDAFIDWSSRDQQSFPGQEEVRKKFAHLLASTKVKLSSQQSTATYKVLTSLARRAILSFPVLTADQTPDPRSIRNYEYLFDYDELEIRQDTMADGFSILGPEEVIKEWFCPVPNYKVPRKEGVSQVMDIVALPTVLLPYLQNRYKKPISPAHASMCTKHFITHCQTTNAFKDWIDSVPWDGQSRLLAVTNSITFADEANARLYQSYIFKALLSMIGIHYWPEDHPKIPAMLILKGPQRTFKSSWAEWLIPPELSGFLGMADTETIISGATERDRLLSTRAVVVVNECEPMFSPRHEQRIKASVDQEMVTYRDLYAPNFVTRQRTALLIGTTNKQDLFTGSLGSRKIWQIPVKLCDSMLILRMDKQQLFAEIKAILLARKVERPTELIQNMWFQDDEELQLVEEANQEARGEQGVDALLVEVFGKPEFDAKEYVVNGNNVRHVQFRIGDPYSLANRPNCWRITGLLRFMKDRFPDDFIDRKSLVYAATRYCEKFTKTQFKTVNIFGDTARLRLVTRGVHEYSKSERLYIFPVIE